MTLTAQSEVGRLRRVLLKTPAAAFQNQQTAMAQWKQLNYLAEPDLAAAQAEYDRFVELLISHGVEVEFLPADERTTLDSIYVRDASIVTDDGAILCNMGKADRRGEVSACADVFQAGILPVHGSVQDPGRIEGGDVAWLDARTLAVGQGYRTNSAGIASLKKLLPESVQLVVVPLPHWQGPADVFHLMSMLSPIDHDLLLVFSPLLPVPFREFLLEQGYRLVEVPGEEFDSMGCNVLALAPRVCLMLDGNPLTRARLEAAGAEVLTYQGEEISRKGCGGPTCLTRPLLRET
jgi:N-dimethylarginine dimethylaminohydrolase